MKQSTMIVLILLMLTAVFGIANYMYNRGVNAFEGSPILPYFRWGFWILIAMFFVGQFFERGNPGLTQIAISRIGSASLAFFLHLLLFVLFIDLVRVMQHFLNFIPETLSSGVLSQKMFFIYGLVFASIATLGGFINASNPVVKEIDLTLDKKDSQRSSLKIALATDVHLGVIRGERHAKKLVHKINMQEPDIVIFGGDLVDHNPNPVMKYDIGTYFDKINAPMGVFATTGNHEFMGKLNTTLAYFENHGIKFIRDSIYTIQDVVQIIGRDDRDKRSVSGEERKSLENIMSQNTLNLPTLLVDHQPVEYDLVKEHGVGLMLSGHTHKGQMWPLNFITSRVYENHFGLMKKGTSWFYTSSGYGTWGPPVRTGNRPELVVFNITFK